MKKKYMHCDCLRKMKCGCMFANLRVTCIKRWKNRKAVLKRILTVDETWLYYFDPMSKIHSGQWKHTRSLPVNRFMRP